MGSYDSDQKTNEVIIYHSLTKEHRQWLWSHVLAVNNTLNTIMSPCHHEVACNARRISSVCLCKAVLYQPWVKYKKKLFLTSDTHDA